MIVLYYNYYMISSVIERNFILKCLSEEAKKLDNSVKAMAFFTYICQKEFKTNNLKGDEFLKYYIKLNSDNNGDMSCKYKIEYTKNKNDSFENVIENFEEYIKNNLSILCLQVLQNIFFDTKPKNDDHFSELINNAVTEFKNILGLEVVELINESSNNIISNSNSNSNSNIIRNSIIGIAIFLIIAGIVFICIKKSNSNNESKNKENDNKIHNIIY